LVVLYKQGEPVATAERGFGSEHEELAAKRIPEAAIRRLPGGTAYHAKGGFPQPRLACSGLFRPANHAAGRLVAGDVEIAQELIDHVGIAAAVAPDVNRNARNLLFAHRVEEAPQRLLVQLVVDALIQDEHPEIIVLVDLEAHPRPTAPCWVGLGQGYAELHLFAVAFHGHRNRRLGGDLRRSQKIEIAKE